MKKIILLLLLSFLVYSLTAEGKMILNSDFEDGGTGNWKGRGSATLTVANDTAYKGKYSVLVKDRTNGWNGAQIDLTGQLLFTGIYHFSAWVKIKEGQPDSEMILTIERSKDGTTNWDRIVLVNAKTGTWANLSGDYEAQYAFDTISVYIESSNATLIYYIDQISVDEINAPEKKKPESEKKEMKNYRLPYNEVPALSDVFKNNFKIGTCVELDQLTGTNGKLIQKHFSSITGENVMKPAYIEPSENNFTFDKADQLVDFAVKNKIAVRGHTLVWHQQNAKWMFYDKNGNKVSKSVLLKRMEKYIRTIVGRYKGKIYAWDVVNEVVDGAGLRNSEWLEICGEEYIEKAFIYARKADPKAKLFINDFNTMDKIKRDTYYKLIKKLKDKRIPIDGIGLQFHISLVNPSIQTIADSIKKYSELGLEIHITELDMSLNGNPSYKPDEPPVSLLIGQGHRYQQIFDIFKQYKNITSVTFWGFSDAFSWLNYFPMKKMDWPLLFDNSLNVKYAYWGLVDPEKLPPQDDSFIPLKNAQIINAKKGTPIIDGIEETLWKKTAEIPINLTILGNGSTGTGKALWDENNLYVFIKVKDNLLSKKSKNEYEQDSIEIFIDEKNNKSPDYLDDDAQYRLNYENELSTNGNAAKIKSAAAITKDGYDIEVMIPLQTIKGVAGTNIGFDLQINDDSGEGIRTSIAKWNDPTNESYINTSGFGTLIFEE